MLLRRTEWRDNQVVCASLDMGGKVRIVDTDLAGDAVERLGEAAIVLVDAGELPADLGPRDARSRPG